LVPYGDRSYHALDMIHPSVKASSEIGRKVAEIIRTN
ncbi:GDSL family lipase, partial [Leisingera sp. ANG-S3]